MEVFNVQRMKCWSRVLPSAAGAPRDAQPSGVLSVVGERNAANTISVKLATGRIDTPLGPTRKFNFRR
jgi:hypothetical protein